MSRAGEELKGQGARLWRVALWLAVYLIVFAAFAFVASRHCAGRGLMATLTFVECAVLAAGVALFCVKFDPRRFGVRLFVAALSAVCVLTLLAGVLVLVAAWALWGAAPLIGGLAAQLVIFSFCMLLAAVFALVRCSGSELLFAQLVCILVACVLMGTVFYADPIIEAQGSSEAKRMVIRAALTINPITAISGSLLGFDMMREQIMYDRISVIARWYKVPYPEWWQAMCGYLALSVVVLSGAGVLRRRHVSRSIG